MEPDTKVEVDLGGFTAEEIKMAVEKMKAQLAFDAKAKALREHNPAVSVVEKQVYNENMPYIFTPSKAELDAHTLKGESKFNRM